MIPVQLIASGVMVAAAFGAGWKFSGDSHAKQLADLHAEHSLALAAATENARANEAKWNDAMAESERVAKTRIAAMARDLAAARHVANGLRDDLSTARSALSTASCGSVREHAATLNSVFGECASAIEGLAGQAQGHAIDSLKLLDSWPRRN